MPIDSGSLERLVPDEIQSGDATGRSTLDLHLRRYEFAARHVRPGTLLDIACGVGYGTRLLADRNETIEAVGVDLDEKAIEYARSRYGGERVSFRVSDALAFRGDSPFHTIVTLETIEHLPDPPRFIAHLVSQLVPGGHLIGSVPTTLSSDANPYHLHDFTEASFRAMMRAAGLEEIESLEQVQRFNPFPLVARREARARDLRENLVGYYLTHPAMALRRLHATLRYGFANRYLTVAWRKPER